MINAPPLPPRFKQVQTQDTGSSVTTAPNSTCGRNFNVNVQRGATLSAMITLTVTDDVTGVKTPVDVTGNTFQYTAKPHQTDGTELLDTDPRTVKIDWQETNTPTLGQTWLIIPAATTQAMQSVPYDHQLRMVSPGNIVTPLFTGSLAVCEPVSARFA